MRWLSAIILSLLVHILIIFAYSFFSYDSPNVEDRTITGIKFLEPEKKEETPKRESKQLKQTTKPTQVKETTKTDPVKKIENWVKPNDSNWTDELDTAINNVCKGVEGAEPAIYAFLVDNGGNITYYSVDYNGNIPENPKPKLKQNDNYTTYLKIDNGINFSGNCSGPKLFEQLPIRIGKL